MIFPVLPLAFSFDLFLSGLLQTLLAGVLFFVALALFRSHLRFQFLTRQVQGEPMGELDINPEDAFQIQAAQYLSVIGKAPQPFAVASLRLLDYDRVQSELGGAAFSELRTYLLESLASVTRRGDTVTWKDERTLGMALQLERPRLENALDRMISEAYREAFHAHNGAYLKPTMVGGCATFPENGFSLRDLVSMADAGLQVALAQPEKALVIAPLEDKAVLEDAEDTAEQAAEEDAEAEGPDEALGLGTAPPSSKNLLDPMTGVLKAERVGPIMQRFVAKYRKDELPVSILYLDIDSLDRYNRHYGHKAGDQIIQAVAQILKDTTREEDIIGRVDGEEFVVNMACRPQDALVVAHRLVAEIKRTQIPFGNSALRITACAGVAGFPDHGGVAKQLYDAAEVALASAKMKGRNMVAMFHKDLRAQQVEVKKVDAF